MMFLNCPAYLDQDRAVRCGLPAEVRCRFTMRSTDGPLESAMIRCPAGHHFNAPIEFLAADSTDSHDPGTAGPGSRAGRDPPSVFILALTVAADPPCATSPPGRSGKAAARTPPPPTTWAAPLPCGSPPCARAAGPPPPLPGGSRRHPAIAALINADT